jgi:hypothetical protein
VSYYLAYTIYVASMIMHKIQFTRIVLVLVESIKCNWEIARKSMAVNVRTGDSDDR